MFVLLKMLNTELYTYFLRANARIPDVWFWLVPFAAPGRELLLLLLINVRPLISPQSLIFARNVQSKSRYQVPTALNNVSCNYTIK